MHRYCGESGIVDPASVVLASAGLSEELMVAEINLARVGEVRAASPYLTRRRPSAGYRQLGGTENLTRASKGRVL